MDRRLFLPTRAEDLSGQADYILVTGDAYVDHPSFGTALIGRLLESMGYTVAVLAQPEFHSKDDFMRFGRPRFCFIVAAGNMDSMVSNYTSSKKKRNQDYYSPNMQAGLRPDRATIVYCNRIREAYKNVPIIIAGIEASLRRFAHYDYWDNTVRRSMLVDSGADMMTYGMAEHQTVEIAKRLSAGERLSELRGIPGTAYICDEKPEDALELPSYEAVCADKKVYAECFGIEYREQDPIRGKKLAQQHREKWLVVEKPAMPLSREELDFMAELPYTRMSHPDYDEDGGIPALEEVQFSISANRGCFGECAFCALTFHQGRIVQSRSPESMLREAEALTKLPNFKGYIHDVGGPTANFMRPACDKQLKYGTCAGKRCLSPTPCPNLVVDHSEYTETLKKMRQIKGVKKVFVRSGIRFDYLMLDKNDAFFRELCQYHISGQLRVAPEHVSPGVLNLMGKPSCEVYNAFEKKFDEINRRVDGGPQYIVSYFMSSHPGSGLKEAIHLAEYMRDHHISPEQVQDFYPTPGTRATCMYYSGYDPITMKKVFVPHAYEEKAMQRALLQYRKAENYELVKKALLKAGRNDLIGYGPHALIAPVPPTKKKTDSEKGGKGGKSVKSAGKTASVGRSAGQKSERKTNTKGASPKQSGKNKK